jgi:hypothetical protein
MKSCDLYELLTERPIVHPTRIDGVSWRGRKLIIAVRGYRWWESPYAERQAEGAMSLVFYDVGGGCLFTDEFDLDDDEALEDFEVRLVSEVPWAQACDWSIYCSGPIVQPLTLYSRVHDYLHLSDAFLTPEHFLNQAADLSRFAAMAQSSGFLVGRGPCCIRDLICDELDRQSVPHNVVRTVGDTEPKFLVRLGRSAFLCESALAELPG